MNNKLIEEIIEERERLESLIKMHSDEIKRLPHTPSGYIEQTIRDSEFYQYHSRQLDGYFKQLQTFNARLTNRQKREISKYKRTKQYQKNEIRLQRLV